jgi:hypothetical protein
MPSGIRGFVTGRQQPPVSDEGLFNTFDLATPVLQEASG